MTKGYLAMILHAHLPYTRHAENPECLEEKWFFEAMTETYIPLVKVFDGLLSDGVDFRMTLSLSPPLILMMSDELLRERYLRHLEKMIELAGREVVRTKGSEFESLARMYFDRFVEIKRIFVDGYQANLLKAFKKFMEAGKLELITTAATHGFLPLMQRRESISAQVAAAVQLFSSIFGRPPRGMWLPECAYTPGVDEMLKSFGVQFFFVDTHGLMFATPTPVNGVYAPLYTPSGVAAFGRDEETSQQVWDMNQGYPGDYYYREFYRDVGFDLDIDYIGPYVGADKIRTDTGIKYYRITGTERKEVYDPQIAAERAAEHAANFIFNRGQQVEDLAGRMDRPPIIVAPYDAELFGHWWYEGPQWIDFLLRKLHYDQDKVQVITPWEYLNNYPVNQVAALPMTSWGHKGYNEVWLDPANDWVYRHLHRAEDRMAVAARTFPTAAGLKERALNQMARELLLAQSSDWTFIMKMGTSVQYAEKRVRDHIARFSRLYWAVMNDDLHDNEISTLEFLDNIFPDIDFRLYKPTSGDVISLGPKGVLKNAANRVLMLSWEFPPKTVGGLARHVYDLSRALAARGEEVHVITSYVPGAKAFELVDGVHVYRVQQSNSDNRNFLDWVERLNDAMIDCAHSLLKNRSFDLLHAHDWLVARAGIALKKSHKIPLISTIHATEFGRNRGISNSIQKNIHLVEWSLTYESWKVICCSKYMAREIAQVFQLPSDKIRIIANGVEVKNVLPRAVDPGFRNRYAAPDENIVYFVGRLVPEKGVQTLINAAPEVLRRCPRTKFVISGRGPHEDSLHSLAKERGVEEKFYFTGFADDETRNMLFAGADVAVFPSLYEPFGIVALEAMASRVPVVVSDTGGLAEVILHENDGLKVRPDDVTGLADGITRLLTDRALADKLNQAAWNKVNSLYNWGVIAGETIRVYREVVAEALNLGYAAAE